MSFRISKGLEKQSQGKANMRPDWQELMGHRFPTTTCLNYPAAGLIIGRVKLRHEVRAEIACRREGDDSGRRIKGEEIWPHRRIK